MGREGEEAYRACYQESWCHKQEGACKQDKERCICQKEEGRNRHENKQNKKCYCRQEEEEGLIFDSADTLQVTVFAGFHSASISILCLSYQHHCHIRHCTVCLLRLSIYDDFFI